MTIDEISAALALAVETDIISQETADDVLQEAKDMRCPHLRWEVSQEFRRPMEPYSVVVPTLSQALAEQNRIMTEMATLIMAMPLDTDLEEEPEDYGQSVYEQDTWDAATDACAGLEQYTAYAGRWIAERAVVVQPEVVD